ncbi:alpha-amylase family glycosyl hydrolase [Halobium salinum]|uniref:Alpha-amylase family glycosyl hydrolase n=1 Tax=Halobium salinum TaxID=1364940 RepID=A0ABD5PF45_9EURY|nr:alpha-amylase family glycosyl hydrolase [Halobium salinum]
MHHPGPPRFMAAGESVELAPRDPDPEATYSWRIKSAPVASRVSLGTENVIDFTPDEAGSYTVELDAPDGLHELTIRVFPGEMSPVAGAGGVSGMSGFSGMSGVSGVSGVSGMSGLSGVSGSGSGTLGASREGQGGGRPRIQLHARFEDDAVVVEAHVKPNPNASTDPDDIGVEFLLDDRDDVSEGDVQKGDRELRIPYKNLRGRVRVHAVAIDDSYSVPDAISIEPDDAEGSEGFATDGGSDFRTDGGPVSGANGTSSRSGRSPRTDGGPDERSESGAGREATRTDGGVVADDGAESGATAEREVRGDLKSVRLNDPPEWAKSVTLYEIYVRGYASDDDEAENTFEALTKRLDYLADLGVDCLWLTPVLQNDHAPHGYNIVDFFSIAEDLGDDEAYKEFVAAAHDRGMKVLFDLVLNHSARDHPYFQDAYKNPKSEYYDWYEWQDSGEPGTYFDWEYIANWNFDNLRVRKHLLEAVDKWAEYVDGFRCDMAWAVPKSFWQEMRERVKETDPEFLLLDETIPYIADFHDGMFDMHFDTTLYFTLRQVGNGNQPADAILDAIEQRTEVGFPDHAAFMLYQENHDETRFVVECGEPAARASAGALFTLPGVPMLYGGQEIGQLGRRDPLAWDQANETIQNHYERLIDARGSTPALQYEGDFARVDYESDSDAVTCFVRGDEGDRHLVALNFGDDPATFETGPEVDTTDLVSGESVLRDGELTVEDVAVLPITG